MSSNSNLRILKPIKVTDAVLVSSSVTENDYPAWNASTTYAAGARVIRTATHRVYQRIVAGTTSGAPEADTANWLDVSPTNRWKMFDSVVNSRTVASGNVTVTLSPGQAHNAVALIDLVATSVRVRQINAVDGVVYDKTISLQAPPTTQDWWTYFFEPIYSRSMALVLDMPTYGLNTTLEITINGTAPECGALLIGTVLTIGEFGIRRGAQVGITDYSRKDRNDFGEVALIERAWSKRAQLDVLVPSNRVDALQSMLAGIRATPTLYVGSDKYDSMVVYGFYKDFSVVIAYPKYSQCHLEIEGMI